MTLHVPLDETTHHLIGTVELASLKPGAVLVNCARGGVVDEAALLTALEDGDLGAAALDVLSEEPPPPGHPFLQRLIDREDVLITPHTGAASYGAMRAMSMMSVQNVLDAFDGKLRDDCTFNIEGLRKR